MFDLVRYSLSISCQVFLTSYTDCSCIITVMAFLNFLVWCYPLTHDTSLHQSCHSVFDRLWFGLIIQRSFLVVHYHPYRSLLQCSSYKVQILKSLFVWPLFQSFSRLKSLLFLCSVDYLILFVARSHVIELFT